MIKKSHNGPRGCMCETVVQTEEKKEPSPAQKTLSSTSGQIQTKNARFALSLLSPDSLIFNKNLKHETCRA